VATVRYLQRYVGGAGVWSHVDGVCSQVDGVWHQVEGVCSLVDGVGPQLDVVFYQAQRGMYIFLPLGICTRCSRGIVSSHYDAPCKGRHNRILRIHPSATYM